MRKYLTIILCFVLPLLHAERRIEPIPYGDMDQWQVRYVKESKIMGDQTKILYALAPNDTIKQIGDTLQLSNF